MRRHLAALLAFGLLASLAAVSPPAAAGCSSLVAQPTGCATAVYNSAKRNALEIAGNAGGWSAAFPGFAAACAQVPEVGLGLPGLPGVPALPGAEPASGWSDDVQGHVAVFRDVAGVDNIGRATADLFAASYGSTIGLALYYSDVTDSILLTYIPEALPNSPDDLPSPPQPGAPEVPDGTADVALALAWAGDNAGQAQGAASAMAVCFQTLPMP